LEYRLRPGARLGHVAINARGFRGPEVTMRPATGTTRVIALGDSCTFGTYAYAGADGSGKESRAVTEPLPHSFPAQLEARLNGDGRSRRYEVMNAGVPGYASRQAALWFVSELAEYRPDIVIVYLGWNDLNNAFAPRWTERWARYDGWRRMLAEHAWGRGFVQLTRRSAIIEALYDGHHSLRNRQGAVAGGRRELADLVLTGKAQSATRILRDNIGVIIEAAKRHGIAPVIVTIPTAVTPRLGADVVRRLDRQGRWADRAAMWTAWQATNAMIRGATGAHGGVLVDLADTFQSLDTAALFSDDNHPNPAGARQVAAVLAEAIRTRVRRE
jgi:lysophospholipase L1-like esterase